MEREISKLIPKHHHFGPFTHFQIPRDFTNRRNYALYSTTEPETMNPPPPQKKIEEDNQDTVFTAEKEKTEKSKETHLDLNENESEKETFWTVCPYCYSLHEYEKVYEDYCLRCVNCEKAFHGVAVMEPKESMFVEGKNQYYCGVGVFGLEYSLGASNDVVVISDDDGDGEGQNVSEKTEVRKQRKVKRMKSMARREKMFEGNNSYRSVDADEGDLEFVERDGDLYVGIKNAS